MTAAASEPVARTRRAVILLPSASFPITVMFRMSKLLLLLVGAALLCGVTACNTISGVGQDVSAVGRDISSGAQGVEQNIRGN
jgi:predicted small secreted protein